MNIKVATSKSDKGEEEFYLVGMECFEDFDSIVNLLTTKFSAKMFEKLDGIYSRIGKFEKDGYKFKLIYHEDVGTYFVGIEQSEEINQYLRRKVDEIIPYLQQLS